MAVIFLAVSGAQAVTWLDHSFNYDVAVNGVNLFVNPHTSPSIPIVGSTPTFSKAFGSAGDDVGSVAQSVAGPDSKGLGLVLKAGATSSHLANGVGLDAYLSSTSAYNDGAPTTYGIEPTSTYTQQVIAWSARRFEVDTAGPHTLDAQLVGGIIDATDYFGGINEFFPPKADYNWDGGVTLFENIMDGSGTVASVSSIAFIDLQDLLAGMLLTELVNLRTQDGTGNPVTYDLKAAINLDSTLANYASFMEKWYELPENTLGSMGTDTDPLALDATINTVPIPGSLVLLISGIAGILGIRRRQKG